MTDRVPEPGPQPAEPEPDPFLAGLTGSSEPRSEAPLPEDPEAAFLAGLTGRKL